MRHWMTILKPALLKFIERIADFYYAKNLNLFPTNFDNIDMCDIMLIKSSW